MLYVSRCDERFVVAMLSIIVKEIVYVIQPYNTCRYAVVVEPFVPNSDASFTVIRAVFPASIRP